MAAPDELDSIVQEAAEGAKAAARKHDADLKPPPEPEAPPLELATVEPRVRPEPEPEPKNPIRWGRFIKRALLTVLALLVAVLAAGAFALYTRTGRRLLPESLQSRAAKAAIEIEQRTRNATGPAFYTFTDDEGVVQIVDDIEKVPKKYRARAKMSH